MTVILGLLEPVPLRAVWAHEAQDFTPWLAEDDNLRLLAEALQLGELELQDTEVAVGNFYIDILARDTEGNLVLIENQFGSTDHTHLGQIMTYVAGQEGTVTIIWIAEAFREEHRAAVDWLNASTIDGFDFFAVEVEALKIGNSLPAPRFNVVAKPNNWSRSVTRATRDEGKPLNDRQKAYVAYWSAFGAFLEDHKAPFRVPTPPPRAYWCNFGIGRSRFSLKAIAGFRDNKLRVGIVIRHPLAKLAFDQLETHRQTIETEFGGALEWHRMSGKKRSFIEVVPVTFDPKNQELWPQQHAWFLNSMERLARAFQDRIQKLDLASTDDSQDDLTETDDEFETRPAPVTLTIAPSAKE